MPPFTPSVADFAIEMSRPRRPDADSGISGIQIQKSEAMFKAELRLGLKLRLRLRLRIKAAAFTVTESAEASPRVVLPLASKGPAAQASPVVKSVAALPIFRMRLLFRSKLPEVVVEPA